MSKYIDADASRDEFMEAVYDILTEDNTNNRANEIIDIFDTLPTAEVEPVKHGKLQFKDRQYHCSECNHTVFGDLWNYCPNCGCKWR